MPGKMASSSATTSLTPWKVMKRVMKSCTTPQCALSSRLTSISSASRLGDTRVGALPTATCSASARLWAASVETTSVRRPSWAERTAVAADRLVLPTPPLPE